MLRTLIRFVLIIPFLLLTTLAPSAQTITGTERRVTTDLGDQYDSAISGNIVVFTDYRSADTDVYYVDLATMLEYPVIVAPGNQELTGVSGGRIVYTDYRTADVVLFNIADGTTENLTRADKDSIGHPFNSVDPVISGTLAVWEDSRDGNMEIYAKDVVTNEERRVTDSTDTDQKPAVSGTVIAWERCAPGGTCDIWIYDWQTGLTTHITDTPDSNERSPAINGQKIAYQGDRTGDSDIYLYDLATGIERQLALPGDQARPHVSGDNVSFDDLSEGLYHIKLWHLPTSEVFDITSGTSGQYLSNIDGNRIVYTDDRNGDLDIYMYTFEISSSSDTEPPVMSGAVDVTVDATSPAGADVVLHVTVADNRDPSPVLSCTSPLSGLFAIGNTEVRCTAIDVSGNSAEAAFTVHVRGADDQLASLPALVASLNIKRGIENSLDAKLNAAMAALDAARANAIGNACNVLGAFVNEVNAQTGKAITAADAASLIAAAQRIRAVLGCV
ncbi:MAG: HYR domain-containing protein [Acidobacteriia bacterium]|nr:HYR domain-containing protein [Terriglobia bacterium]